ncbi:hypothetical protein R1T08_21600 [Streptomyces sp. SBC-4]|nr:hypothetical protein [Streptomyces sp. SBC-4]MDV5146712.1 hypothetical protein [Streptomyces sp. SBC-4]
MQAGIQGSNLSAAEKAKVQKSLDDLVSIINDPAKSNDERANAAFLAAGIGEALKLSKDPATSKEDAARYAKLVLGISEAMQKATDPNVPPDEQDAYDNILGDLDEIIGGLTATNLSPADKIYYSKWADLLLGGLLAVQQPGTAPTEPEDKKKLQEQLKKQTEALKTYQNPNASQEDRDAAKATLDEQAAATTNAQYLKLVEELKRLRAPQACLDVVQNRTQQAGWPDGSLWALTDKACDAPVRAGAADTNSEWNALFTCVLSQAFSTCTARIPE